MAAAKGGEVKDRTGAGARFTPVRKMSTYEIIVEQIEKGLASGRLRPGDRLPGERQLMADFSVSRPTVREALRVLQATGIVESRPGDPRGPIITGQAADVLERPLARLARMDTVSRSELLQFRLILEGHAALLASRRRSDEELEQITAAASAIAELAAADDDEKIDPERFGQLVSRLHETIRAASGNALVQACGAAIGGVWQELAARRLVDERDRRRRIQRSAGDAAVLVERIAAGDASGAQHAAVANIYRYYRDQLTPQEREDLEVIVWPAGVPADETR